MRSLLALAAALALAVPALAQPTSLSGRQLDAYRAARLQVEAQTNRRSRAEWTPYGYEIHDVTTTRWRGAIGRERVGEVAFYRHAGADDLAAYVASRRRPGWVAVGLGAAAVAGGVVLIATAPDGDDNRFTTTQLTGLGISLTGLSAAAYGYLILNRNHTSARDAAAAADRFNQSLERIVRQQVPADE